VENRVIVNPTTTQNIVDHKIEVLIASLSSAGFVLGACRQGICFVPIILLLPSFWGINGILYAQPIADVISAIVTVFMALHLHKELATTKEH